ncbi:zinc-binding dehydrogenase [Sagittula sp. SSi028]|uniref:zinc-binding dehydrogenase n=1 Tax=Sagittula sp. SSi028 TaxID=3400636 RepID=UPI003AF52E2A
MKAIVHDTFGDPTEVLQTREVDTPEPKEGQVLLKVGLAPIHNHDLWTIHGSYGVKPDLPAIAGSEAMGVVEKVGPGVSEDLIGQRVNAAGVKGAYAEYTLANAATLVPLPEVLSDEAGAQLVAMPFSAITLLDFLNVSKGDWIVQTAANGAVGKILAALAKSRGIKVLNIVRRAGARDELKELGLENIVVTDDADWVEQAQKIIGTDGARAAVDSVGGDIGGDLVTLLGQDGLLVTFGTATGAPLTFDTGAIIFKHIVIKGFWGKRVIEEMAPEHRKDLMVELVTLAAQGKIPLTTDGVFGLDQGAEAAKASRSAGRTGKVMIKP